MFLILGISHNFQIFDGNSFVIKMLRSCDYFPHLEPICFLFFCLRPCVYTVQLFANCQLKTKEEESITAKSYKNWHSSEVLNDGNLQ